MNHLALAIAAVLVLADAGPAPPAGTSPDRRPDARVPATFGSSDIRDWYAPDDTTLVINTHGHGRFRATFMGRCPGIRFVETVGFHTLGPWELDASTLVVLPDGRRCALRSLEPYGDAEERADREARRRAREEAGRR